MPAFNGAATTTLQKWLIRLVSRENGSAWIVALLAVALPFMVATGSRAMPWDVYQAIYEALIGLVALPVAAFAYRTMINALLPAQLLEDRYGSFGS